MRITVLIIILCFFTTFLTAQSRKINNKDLKTLVEIMAGDFSSEIQSKNDSDYYHIKLRMKPVFLNNKDGYWLYVEQAMATSENKPYRQRVYHVYIQDDSTIVSKVYEIRDPAKYTNGWKNPDRLNPLSVDSLIDRQGCGIYLHWQPNGTISGSTPGKECLSTLRGATYATSEVVIYADKLISWDRGWDKNDKQVWGAVKGGYIFKKLSSFE